MDLLSGREVNNELLDMHEDNNELVDIQNILHFLEKNKEVKIFTEFNASETLLSFSNRVKSINNNDIVLSNMEFEFLYNLIIKEYKQKNVNIFEITQKEATHIKLTPLLTKGYIKPTRASRCHRLQITKVKHFDVNSKKKYYSKMLHWCFRCFSQE